jgi:ABC-type nitrate/sulfonate/bicarbonate transport system substrate-binding protein
MRRLTVTALALLVLSAAAPAWALDRIRVGHIVDIDSIPLLVMVEKGIDRKHELEVDLKGFPSSSAAHTALRGGALDSIANMGTNAAALLNAEGGDVKIVRGFSLATLKVAVKKDSPLKTLADLKGQKLAVTSLAGSSYIMTAMVLKARGLDPKKDLEVATVPSASLVAALDKGQVAAATVWEPFATKAVKEGAIRILVDLGQEYRALYNGEEFVQGGTGVAGAFLAQKRDVVARYVKALDEAVAFTMTQAAEADRVAATELKMSPAEIAEIRANWPNGWVTGGLTPKLLDEANAMYKRMFDLGIHQKLVDAKSFWVAP